MDIRFMNFRTFDLNLLRALDALLQETQVSAAARRLNLSQPATSAALARLRNALGDELLVRTGNGMERTALARELRPKVSRVLAEIEQTLSGREAFDPTDSDRCFRIAANDYAVVAVISPLLQQLQRGAPRIAVEILPFEDNFDDRLAEGNYDVVVRDRWSLRSWRHSETLFQEQYVCVARRDHPRLSRKPTLDQFLTEGHILISPPGRPPGVVDMAIAPLNRARRVMVTLPHFLAAPVVISKRDYVMTIPRRIALQLSQIYDLRVFHPPVRLRGFDVVMAWHPRSEAEAGVIWLRQQVKRAASKAP
jgi:DNA-binding transcriptional LysR family regulator